MGEMRDVYRVLVGKPQGNSQLGKLTRRQEDNIKMCVQEMEWGHYLKFIWLRMGIGGALC